MRWGCLGVKLRSSGLVGVQSHLLHTHLSSGRGCCVQQAGAPLFALPVSQRGNLGPYTDTNTIRIRRYLDNFYPWNQERCPRYGGCFFSNAITARRLAMCRLLHFLLPVLTASHQQVLQVSRGLVSAASDLPSHSLCPLVD